MKPDQKHRAAAKKSVAAETPMVCAGAPAQLGAKPRSTFESPSAAVWSKYIDSRMKQFGTR